MNYSDIIGKSIEGVYQKGIATKIMQQMDRIRNVSDLSQARRWVMELFQNSRDVSYEDQPVKIKIQLLDDQLIFSHNGKPFRVKDILSIINQVSGKQRLDDSTIGQFGTGFMTTFQLSPKVEIKSVLRDSVEQNGQKMMLPYKKFHIVLDRDGQTEDEILDGIARTMDQLNTVDKEEEITDFQKDDFHTNFIYHLDNDESREIAKTGIDDLNNTIFEVLLFSKKIDSVTISYHCKGVNKEVIYRKVADTEFRPGYRIAQFLEKNIEERSHWIVYKTDGTMTLAARWDEKEGFLPMLPKAARLFIDFPLIGSEQFPFPVIINERNFRPNEPRSGITLVDKTLSRDSNENKQCMDKGVMLYLQFVHDMVTAGEKNIENIIAIPNFALTKEMSETWIKEHIYQAIFESVQNESFVPTKKGNASIATKGFYFLQAESEEEGDGLRQLMDELDGFSYPEENKDYAAILQGYEPVARKIITVETLLNSAEGCLQNRIPDKKNAMPWLQKLYDVSMKNEQLKEKIMAGTVQIFPNQHDWEQSCKLHTIVEIQRDPQIPEILKDVSEILSHLTDHVSPASIYSIRTVLLHEDFDDHKNENIKDYEPTILNDFIMQRCNRRFPVTSYNKYANFYENTWKQAWKLMISCNPDKELYQAVSVFEKEDLPEWKPLGDDWDSRLWNTTYISYLAYIMETISKKLTIKNVWEGYCTGWTEEQFYGWYNTLLSYGLKWPGDNNCFFSVFPNQRGNLKLITGMKRDMVQDETIKSIVFGFFPRENTSEYNIYENLLDNKITKYPENMYSYTLLDAAKSIMPAVTRLLQEKSLSEAELAYQDICTELLSWIQANPDKATSYFPEYSSEENQMKLLTPKAASRLNQKAREFTDLMKQVGVDSVEEFKSKIQQLCYDQNDFLDYEDKYGVSIDDYDPIFGGKSYSEKEEICRKIGKDGERYVYEQLISQYEEKGYQAVARHEQYTTLQRILPDETTEKVQIEKPDSGNYHQEGWDICIKDGERCRYIEVKTHTAGSVMKNSLRLSEKQMKKALIEKENYFICFVTYNWANQKAEKMTMLNDVSKQIENGTIKHNGCYEFIIQLAA